MRSLKIVTNYNTVVLDVVICVFICSITACQQSRGDVFEFSALNCLLHGVSLVSSPATGSTNMTANHLAPKPVILAVTACVTKNNNHVVLFESELCI